ncbi:MAG: hypothetical protein RMA76_14850 [Deltaproteobacteria bacterium]|jgi:hypothetical protein
MRRWLLSFALLGACAQPGASDDVPLDDPPTEPVGTPPPPSGTALPTPKPARYFTATASLEVVERYDAAFGAPAPRRLTPRRGRDYGQGEGRVSFEGTTPSEHLVIVRFVPLDSGAGSTLYAVSARGVAPDAPVRVADNVRAFRSATITDREILYVAAGGLYAAALDGSEASSPRRLFVEEENAVVERVQIARPYVGLQIKRIGDVMTSLVVVRLDPTAPAPFPIELQHRGAALRGALPDGRLLLYSEGWFGSYDPGESPAFTAATWGDYEIKSVLDEGPTLVTWRDRREIGLLRLDDPNPVVRRLIFPLDEEAVALSQNGRQLWGLAWGSSGVEIRHAAVESAVETNLVGELNFSSTPQLAVSSDGRFAVVCDRFELWKYALNEPPRRISPDACLGYGLAGIVGGDGAVLLLSPNELRVVSLEDGRTEESPGPTVLPVVLRDAVLGFVETRAESTIYRMESVDRVRQMLPWRSEPFERIVELEDDLLYRRGDDWFALSKADGVERRVAVDRPYSQLLGVTDGYVVLEEGSHVRSFPLDGSRSDTPTLDVEEPTRHLETAIDRGRVIWIRSNGMATMTVDGTDELGSYTSSYTVRDGAYDPVSERVILVSAFNQSTHAVAVSLDGDDVLELIDGSSGRVPGWPSGVHVVEGAARVVLTVEQPGSGGALLPKVLASVQVVDNPRIFTVSDTGQRLWAGPQSPYLSNGTRAVVTDTSATFVASLTQTKDLRSIVTKPLAQIGPNTISPDGRWLLGAASDGVYAARTDGAEELFHIAANAFAARFSPASLIVFGVRGDDVDSGLWVRSVSEDEPVRITPLGFPVSELLDSEIDGSLVVSRSGGDRSIFWVPHDGARPTAVTPIDDAYEVLVEKLTSN